MPGDDARALHRALVQNLLDRGLLSEPNLKSAFREVPRHLFLPGVPVGVAYADEAIPTKRREGLAISSSSQPAVMAIMLRQLGLRQGHRVLEIGAGTGYNAALMAHIVGPAGHVVTLDIDQDIVDASRSHLAAAGFTGVEVVCRDGALGYAEAAPYDRIILTAGAWDLAPAWSQQLGPGGRLVLPLSLNGTVQTLVAFQFHDRFMQSVSVENGVFMPLRGGNAGPTVHVTLGGDRDIILGLASPRLVDARRVHDLLLGPYQDRSIEIRVTAGELWAGVSLWLALYAPEMCSLVATSAAAARASIPAAFSNSPTFHATAGLLSETSLCLLGRGSAESLTDSEYTFSLSIRTFGADQGLANRLTDLLHAWVDAGRPSSKGLRITAYPWGALPATAPGAIIIHKPQTHLVLDWRNG